MLGPRVRLTHLFVLAAAFALIAAACSGGGEGEDQAAQDQPAAEEEEKGGGGDRGELAGLAQQWDETSASITFEVTGEGFPPGEMILHWKPPGSWRTDFSTQEGESIFISAGDTSYLCGSGIGDQEAGCFEAPGSDAQAVPFAGLFTQPEALVEQIDAAPGGADIERGSETIAGEEASCFRVTGADESQGGLAWCFASDGILLRTAADAPGTEGEGGGQFVLEATSVKRKVADDAFEPPFPVMEIPQSPAA
jgi:hypothetical protein